MASVVVLALLFAVIANAAAESRTSPVATCRGATNWSAANRLIGRVATIRGRVASTKFAASSNGSPTFLNLGVPYPEPRRFTVVIWIENRARFDRPEVRYLGRTVCVRGLIRSYRGGAETFATSPAQIAIAR
jgi:hypothetical protein